MKVKKLGSDVRSRLESGLIITDATQCAMELVENALDAKCTAVAVRINLKDYTIQVVDNGTGISPDNFQLVGERFMTSKCRNVDHLKRNMSTFGYRGQAIASIIDVSSKLVIETKSEWSSKTLVKVFAKGKTPSVSVSSKEKYGHGTTVTVYDFMGTLPVRQKRISELFDVEEIKNQLEYLALICDQVRFTLRDENKGQIILQSEARRNSGFSFADLFGMAAGKFLVPIRYKEDKIKVEGFIGLERYPESNLQFFYVNKRIVSKSLIHKFVNGLIDRYLKERQSLAEEFPDLRETNLNLGKNCHNVYLLQVKCPYTYYDMYRSLRKTTVEFGNWDRIFQCLKNAIKCVAGVDTGNLAGCDDFDIPQNRKNENAGNCPGKYKEKLAELKCGIRGVSVKRKGDQVGVTDEKSVSNHVNFVRREISEKNDQVSKKLLLKPLAFGHGEGGESGGKAETPMVSEDFGEEKTIGSNTVMEFADWLKSKLENDRFMRELYREFVKRKVSLRDKVKLERRKRELTTERKGNLEGKRIFRCEGRQLKRELSVPLHNPMENNNSGVECSAKVKKLQQLKKERKSGGFESTNEMSAGKVRIGFPFADAFSRVRAQIKPFVDCEIRGNCIGLGDSSKSWVSHENRTASIEKWRNSSTANCGRTRKSKGSDEDEKKEREESGSTTTIEKENFGGRREIEVQTSTRPFNLDKGIQINVLDEQDEDDNVHRDAELVSLTCEIDPERGTVSDWLDDIVDRQRSCESVGNVSLGKDLKEVALQNVADTLSVTADGDCSTRFTFTDRYTFIPKGLSPSVLNRGFVTFGSGCEDEISEACDGTWEGNSCGLFTRSFLPNEVMEEFKENVAGNMIYYERELIKCQLTKGNPTISTFAVDKDILSSVQVVGQWDNKFIIGKTCPLLPDEKQLLLLFDQHAIDERIQLEKLLKECRNSEGKFISTNCIPPMRCKMEKSTLRLIPSLETIFSNIGMKVCVVDSDYALFQQIPICLVQDYADSVETFLKNLVNEIVEEFNETRGFGSTIPRILATLISTRACKSAVKFNEILSLEKMVDLISNLVTCEIPFQCAHGRPSLVPLLDVKAFANQTREPEEKLNFKKFRKLIIDKY